MLMLGAKLEKEYGILSNCEAHHENQNLNKNWSKAQFLPLQLPNCDLRKKVIRPCWRFTWNATHHFANRRIRDPYVR
jgi:hypothetical protein